MTASPTANEHGPSRDPDHNVTTQAPPRLIPLPDGPYRLIGQLALVDEDGQVIQTPTGTIHLCRCGRSATKPFCDGSHARTAWTSADQ